jgi:hypothetical protein
VTGYLLHRLLLRAVGVPMPDGDEIARYVELWLQATRFYDR